MGGLSVFSQTELVQPASEATVAQAIAESRKSDKRKRSIGIGVVGASMLLGLGLLAKYAPRKAERKRGRS